MTWWVQLAKDRGTMRLSSPAAEVLADRMMREQTAVSACGNVRTIRPYHLEGSTPHFAVVDDTGGFEPVTEEHRQRILKLFGRAFAPQHVRDYDGDEGL